MKFFIMSLIATSLFGCATANNMPVNGIMFTNAQGPVSATTLPIGSASGEACATSIMGLIGTGDASIKAAAEAGGINRVTAVDTTGFSVLGVYAKSCTIVYGTGGKSSGMSSKRRRSSRSVKAPKTETAPPAESKDAEDKPKAQESEDEFY